MATYAIGDVQGCAAQLGRLVERVRFTPQSDQLWFVGDLVNRGPSSLEVLRYVKGLGRSARVVLGNHDLFLLAVSERVVPLRPKDTISDILEAEDRGELLDWLRHRPLHVRENAFFMVHAGLLPHWTIEEAANLAAEVESVLREGNYVALFQELFHGPVTTWNPNLKGFLRWATLARIFTRIRTCTTNGETASFSGPPDETPAGYSPWFRLPSKRADAVTVITGHWAALGLHIEPNLLAIDSGCVWGRQLTAVRLEDRKVFQVDGLTRR